MDLVVQSAKLAVETCDAFKVAMLAEPPLRHERAARLRGVDDDAFSRRVAGALAAYWRCDANFVRPGLRTGDFRVLVMDMDSTAITIECIDELARMAGQGEAVAAITAAAMRGEIADYAESLRRRVALLAGAPAALLQRVAVERLRYSDGVRRLLQEARRLGWSTLLVSGGFTYFAEQVGRELGFDAVRANDLVVHEGSLSGEVTGPREYDGRILDAAGKARMLQQLCGHAGCGTDRALAIGDGANDLQMMAAAGLSIAYRAKPLVRQHATCSLEHTPLDGVLELFEDCW